MIGFVDRVGLREFLRNGVFVIGFVDRVGLREFLRNGAFVIGGVHVIDELGPLILSYSVYILVVFLWRVYDVALQLSLLVPGGMIAYH